MTEAGIIVPMKTARGYVEGGRVSLDHPLPEGEVVFVRLLTEAEEQEDREVWEELKEEMRPFREASKRAFAKFAAEHLGDEDVQG